MNTIYVYYDLNDPGHQYTELINYLESNVYRPTLFIGISYYIFDVK